MRFVDLGQYFLHMLLVCVYICKLENPQNKTNRVEVKATRYKQCSETSSCNFFGN